MKKLLLYFLLLFAFLSCEAQVTPSQSALITRRETLTIASIADATPQSVAYNTAFGSLTLPSTRNVTLSNGQVISTAITWDDATYDPVAPGEQTIFGDPTVPNWFTNPLLSRALAVVNVQEQITTETITAPTGGQAWEVPEGVDTITTAEVIGSGATGGSVGIVNRAPGGGAGAYALKNDIPVTAGDILPLYIGIEQLGPLPSGSDIDGLNGQPSYFGPAIPAGSTLLFGSGAPGGGTGSDGNYYSDYTTGNLYGPKASGSWPGSPTAPYALGAAGTAGTGVSPGTAGAGGTTAASIGDTKFRGGNPIAAPASRGGAGGGAAGPTGQGGDASTSGGTNSVGGTGATVGISGNGGNGSAGTPGVTGECCAGGAGARNTSISNTRGGAGESGWARLIYSGSSVPPADPGAAYDVAIWGQSNVISPGNGSPGSPYTGVLESKIWINSADGFKPLEYGVNNNPGGSPTGLGPELSIANAIDALAVDETYIIKKGQSGTSMHTHWNVANNSTGRSAVAQLVAAITYQVAQGKTIEEIYVVFRQGEADIPSTNPNGPVGSNVEAEYKDKLQDLIAYTIDKLEDPVSSAGANLDLTVVEFHWITVVVDNTTTADHAFQTEIISAQTDGTLDFDTDRSSYASKTAGLHIVSTAGLTTMDGIHFGTSSEITIGASAATFMTITP